MHKIERINYTTYGVQGICKTPRCPPTATPNSYPQYKTFTAQLMLYPRFVDHKGENQQEILDWVEQDFFLYLNDLRSKRIRTDHDKKMQMFWTIVERILDKYVSELSSDADDVDDADDADDADEQTFAGASLLPPITCHQYLKTTISEILALFGAHSVATCADNVHFFAWETAQSALDLDGIRE